MPILGACYQFSRESVSLDISQDSEQMLVLLDQARLVAALPEPPGGSVLAVMSAHMRREQPTSPRRNVVAPSRPHDKMHMIRHEANGEQRQFDTLLRLAHVSEEGQVVSATVKDASLLVAAIDYVVALIRRDHSRGTGHALRYRGHRLGAAREIHLIYR